MNEKNIVLQRLCKREAQRLEQIEKQHKAKSQDAASNEQMEYFNAIFKEKSQKVETALNTVSSIEQNQLHLHFENIKKELTELQKYVSASSLFLKEFSMRKCLSVIQNLQSQCYELEDKYIPRKKFGFSKVNKIASNVSNNISNDSTKDEIDANKIASKKWECELFGFEDKENEYLSLTYEEIFQRDVSLRNLKKCTVILKGILGTLHMSNLEECIILTGPISSSVFVEKCTDCKIVVACQQLRMHSSTHCDVYLHVTCKGIIEDCSKIRTAPYNLTYDDLDLHFTNSSLESKVNNWDDLDDFNWLVHDMASPNWCILPESERITDWRPWLDKIPNSK